MLRSLRGLWDSAGSCCVGLGAFPRIGEVSAPAVAEAPKGSDRAVFLHLRQRTLDRLQREGRRDQGTKEDPGTDASAGVRKMPRVLRTARRASLSLFKNVRARAYFEVLVLHLHEGRVQISRTGLVVPVSDDRSRSYASPHAFASKKSCSTAIYPRLPPRARRRGRGRVCEWGCELAP